MTLFMIVLFGLDANLIYVLPVLKYVVLWASMICVFFQWSVLSFIVSYLEISVISFCLQQVREGHIYSGQISTTGHHDQNLISLVILHQTEVYWLAKSAARAA